MSVVRTSETILLEHQTYSIFSYLSSLDLTIFVLINSKKRKVHSPQRWVPFLWNLWAPPVHQNSQLLTDYLKLSYVLVSSMTGKKFHSKLCSFFFSIYLFFLLTNVKCCIIICFWSNVQIILFSLLLLLLFFFHIFLPFKFLIPRRIQGLLTNNIIIEGRLRIEELEKFVNQVSAHNQVRKALLLFVLFYFILFYAFKVCDDFMLRSS